MTAQLSLEDAVAARIRCRRTDPMPSFAAAAELVGTCRLGLQQAEAMVLVDRFPGATAWELAEGDVELRYRLNRRLPELVRKGLVRRGEARSCRVKGRPATTWWPA